MTWYHCHRQRYSTAIFSLPFFFLLFLLCCFFLHIIFRLVSFRTAPACTAPGGWREGLPFDPQAAAAPPARAHPVCSPAPERPGPPAAGDPAAAPAVPGETQTAIPAAAAAHQQGRREAFNAFFPPQQLQACDFRSSSAGVVLGSTSNIPGPLILGPVSGVTTPGCIGEGSYSGLLKCLLRG